MALLAEKEFKRINRHQRIRKKITGSQERPRLCVHRSLKNFSAQIIDDTRGQVLFGMTTMGKVVREKIKTKGKTNIASSFGEMFAQEAQKKGIKRVSFDRGGYLFHGRVKAFAEAARKGGLEF